MPPARNLTTAYRAETEQLTAERLPQAIVLFLAVSAVSGVMEYNFSPHNVPLFLVLYGLLTLTCVPSLAWRQLLLRHKLLTPAAVATALALSLLMHGYYIVARIPSELTATASVCMMAGMSLLMPWGTKGQIVVSLGTSLAAAAVLYVNGVAVSAPAYVFFGVGTGAALSVLGARYMDLHRFAIFREATLGEEEGSISRTLVSIAKSMNATLDAADVPNRIASSTRAALGCDWSTILLWNEESNAFQVAGSAGREGHTLDDFAELQLSRENSPLINRILSEGYVEIDDCSAPNLMASGVLQRLGSRWFLGTTLMRSGEIVGILWAGTAQAHGAVTDRTRELFRGIAQHAAIALNNMKLVTDLRRANNLKSEFLATMSHELRTPLNVIVGYSDLLIEGTFGSLQQDAQQVLGRLRSSALTLQELINATLDVNRLEAGRSPVQLQDVNLGRLIDEIRQECDLLPRKPGVALLWTVSTGKHTVYTDPGKFKIALKNLIGNALKFTETGRVKVEIELGVAAQEIRARVEDTGAGIAETELPHIFGMFQQAGSEAQNGGVGLGLYIVKRFVEQLGGNVSATSIRGRGSTFEIRFPIGLDLAPQECAEESSGTAALAAL